MPRRTAPIDPRDISTSALLTEIEPEVTLSTAAPVSENGSEEAAGSSPPSTGSFVHVEEEPEAVVVVVETEVEAVLEVKPEVELVGEEKKVEVVEEKVEDPAEPVLVV